MAAAEGPVAEFSSFANFDEKMSFPKTVNQIGSFSQIRKNSLFRFCRPILVIFGFTLLRFANSNDAIVNQGLNASYRLKERKKKRKERAAFRTRCQQIERSYLISWFLH